MGLISNKAQIKLWLICPKCKINIPKISKYLGNNSFSFTLSIECLCYEKVFQMLLSTYLSILKQHYTNNSPLNDKKSKCFNCDSSECLDTYCLECSGFLCKKCSIIHSNNYTHNYSNNQTIIQSKCQLHKQINTLYCLTCEREICFQCRDKDRSHFEHLVFSIKQYCKSIKDKWTFPSMISLKNTLNCYHSNNEDLLSLIELLYVNYEALIEIPSINITKSITELQREISVLRSVKQKEVYHLQSHITTRFNIKLKSKCIDLYQIQYCKPSKMIQSIDCPFYISLLIILTDKRFAFLKAEHNNPKASFSINICKAFNESFLEIPEQYENAVALIEFDSNRLIIATKRGQIDIWGLSSLQKLGTLINQNPITSLIKLNEEKIYVNGTIESVWNINTATNTLSSSSGTVIYFNNEIYVSYRKNIIEIWNINQNNKQLSLEENNTSIAFVGKINNVRIISSSFDCIIKIWNVKFKKSISTITLPNVIIEKGIIAKDREILYFITNDYSLLLFDYGANQINTVIQMQHFIKRIVQIDNYRVCCLLNNNKIYIITN